MIGFKEKGIKISINQNKISFHDPNFYQGPLRWHSGDNRNDLHNLHNPIVKCTEWYDTNIKEIRSIISFSLKGLENLKESYESQSIIQHTLDHYVSLLKESIKDCNQEKKISGEQVDMSASLFKDNSLEDIPEKKYNNNEELDDDTKILKEEINKNFNLIYKDLKQLWTYREIKIINNILIEMSEQEKTDDDFKAYLNSIHNIVEAKDKRVYEIIQQMTTIL